jgi:hypothetical protein
MFPALAAAIGGFAKSAVGSSLLSGVGSALAGLIGGRDKGVQRWQIRQYGETQRAEQRRNLVNLRTSAEAAGFNPLTVLRATGGSLPGTATPSGALSSSSAFRMALADGVRSGIGTLLSHDPMAAERDALEQGLMREQIATLQYERSRDQALGSAPVYDRFQGPVQGTVARGSTRGAAPAVGEAPTGPVLPRIPWLLGSTPLPTNANTQALTGGVGREVEHLPNTTGPGMTVVQGNLSGGVPVSVPGDGGEPWGVDELATYAIFAAPQLAWAGVKKWPGWYRAYNDWLTAQPGAIANDFRAGRSLTAERLARERASGTRW